jgi:arylformamidase
MVANIGTYIDCPFHRYADGDDLSETALERFADLPAATAARCTRSFCAMGS